MKVIVFSKRLKKEEKMSEDLKEYFDKKFGNFREIIHQFHVISEDVISKSPAGC
jgi:hypothetical protein